MSEHFFIRPVGEQLEWLLLDEFSGEVRLRGKGNDEQCATLLADIAIPEATTIVVPGERILLTRVAVPTRQARHVQQAVPFLVEENLAVDLEECHFATGDRIGDRLLVAIIDRNYLSELLARIRALGLTPVSATIPGELVARSPDATVVQFDDKVMHVIREDATGLTVPAAIAAETLALVAAESQTMRIRGTEQQLGELRVALDAIAADDDNNLTEETLEDAGFEHLIRHYSDNSLNLLQGDFSVRVKRERQGQGWMTAAMLAGSVFVFHLLLTLGQAIYLDQRAMSYQMQAQALYSDVFPRDRNVRDLRRRWRAHLNTGDGQSGQFLELLKQTAGHLPGGDVQVRNVNFNERRGDLVLQMQALRSEQLVALSQALNSAGLDSEIGNISQDEDTVRGSLKVRLSES